MQPHGRFRLPEPHDAWRIESLAFCAGCAGLSQEQIDRIEAIKRDIDAKYACAWIHRYLRLLANMRPCSQPLQSTPSLGCTASAQTRCLTGPTRLPAYTSLMYTYTAVIERCRDTGLYVGYVPGFPGAHSQGETLDELNADLREVIALILDDGAPEMVGDYVGRQTVVL